MKIEDFVVREVVPAKTIWPASENFEDKGNVDGYVRGYNVEVANRDGVVDWMSCVWIRTSIEEYMADEFTQWWYNDLGVVPTGRISFRGYGIEKYDLEERDIFVEVKGQL